MRCTWLLRSSVDAWKATMFTFRSPSPLHNFASVLGRFSTWMLSSLAVGIVDLLLLYGFCEERSGCDPAGPDTSRLRRLPINSPSKRSRSVNGVLWKTQSDF